MKCILFIEDEHAFAIGLIDRLRAEDYEVQWESNGNAGQQAASANTFDLILLDVSLPAKNGFDICRDLRRDNISTPVLMLTARGEVIDRVLGLKLGADDYVQKNCEPIELMARIEALLRRSQPSATSPDITTLGDIRIDFRQHEVSRAGIAVILTPIEFRLLKYLNQHRGNIITREELLENVWAADGSMLSRTVDVHVAGLRKKIEEDPRYPRFLLTIKGAGYKLAL
ncbi:response regulator transcription factor [Terriglobus roseus]|uniref:Phosphate regulon transcriptional regulatory protein PhoB n=1 Tax=Terriglobus roseus TaxID=392734 RepID=A0A1G7MFB0_9BACT|nr:response regulator transcription factor [Terriglobus roseus]SDF60407.1 DNA-binding response regulator, OmpR family, contains REC and winged-helix (wHTH) domain [Terriglobus roseus]